MSEVQDERRTNDRAPSPQAAQEDGWVGIGGVDFPHLPADLRHAADGLDADHLAENAVRGVAVSAAVVAEESNARSIPDIALPLESHGERVSSLYGQQHLGLNGDDDHRR